MSAGCGWACWRGSPAFERKSEPALQLVIDVNLLFFEKFGLAPTEQTSQAGVSYPRVRRQFPPETALIPRSFPEACPMLGVAAERNQRRRGS
jgi:hypothetical protein